MQGPLGNHASDDDVTATATGQECAPQRDVGHIPGAYFQGRCHGLSHSFHPWP